MPKEEIKNQLLRRLSDRDRALLGPLKPVHLALREPLELADTGIEFVYFLEHGFASIVADAAGKDPIEIGLIGREGMTGVAILLGDSQSPFDTFVQGEGSALRVSATQLCAALSESPTLRALFLLYLRSFLTQALQSLEAAGLIHTIRGSVEVIDRKALIASTNGAYGVAEREYLRLFP